MRTKIDLRLWKQTNKMIWRWDPITSCYQITEGVKVSSIKQSNWQVMMRVSYLTIMERCLRTQATRKSLMRERLSQEHQFQLKELTRLSIIWLNSSHLSKTEAEVSLTRLDILKILRMQIKHSNQQSKMAQDIDHFMKTLQLQSITHINSIKLQTAHLPTVSIESLRWEIHLQKYSQVIHMDCQPYLTSLWLTPNSCTQISLKASLLIRLIEPIPRRMIL